MAQRSKSSDDDNADFTVHLNVVRHKPGFQKAAIVESDTGENHRFKSRPQKDVPKESLAARLARLTKEG